MDRRLAEIRPKDLTRWVDERQRKKISGSTINRDMAAISALYKWAVRGGYVEQNPATARHVQRFPTGSKGREVYLTASEVSALLEACSDVLRPVVLTAVSTGMRKGELLSLCWRSVDVEGREIYIRPENEKAGRGRSVRLTVALQGEMRLLKASRRRPAFDGSDPVFTLRNGSRIQVWDLRKMWKTAKDAAEGIPVAKRQVLRFHDLRHSAASLMVAAGVPLFDVAKVLGHSTLAVTMKYAHFQQAAGLAAVDRIGEALATAEKAQAETG